MRYFKTFSEEEQEKILEENKKWLRENIFILDEERIRKEIGYEIENFRRDWQFKNGWIDFKINEEDDITYAMKEFLWSTENICKIASEKNIVERKKRIFEDISWFEKIGGMNFTISVGMHLGKFEINSSKRIELTKILTLDQRTKRIEILLEEYEDDEEMIEEIKKCVLIKSFDKKKNIKDRKLDAIISDTFYKKRKEWSKKLENQLEKDFEEVKKKNKRIIDYYAGTEQMKKRLISENLLYFTKDGVPLKK